MVECCRQSGLAHSDVMNVAWNCKYTLCMEIAYTNYFAGSLDIYADKTPVPDFGALSAHPSISKKLYYNSGLSLNESIDLTSTGL
jgi:hypothetical protein